MTHHDSTIECYPDRILVSSSDSINSGNIRGTKRLVKICKTLHRKTIFGLGIVIYTHLYKKKEKKEKRMFQIEMFHG